jgi:NifU-like protein
MTKKEHHYLFWDLYSSKMRKLILEHKHAKKCAGEIFFYESCKYSYQLDLKYCEEKEHITDFFYLVSAPSFMIALLEGLCSLVKGKKAAKLGFIRASDIFEEIEIYQIVDSYSDKDIADYISYISPFVNHLIDSFSLCIEKIIPIKYTTPQGLSNFSMEANIMEGFINFSKEVKISCIEEVMEKDIRPYIALDDGNVKIKDITKNHVVLIEYEGNCTSCHAAGSTTLSAIASILKAKIHPEIEVLPFLS